MDTLLRKVANVVSLLPLRGLLCLALIITGFVGAIVMTCVGGYELSQGIPKQWKENK